MRSLTPEEYKDLMERGGVSPDKLEEFFAANPGIKKAHFVFEKNVPAEERHKFSGSERRAAKKAEKEQKKAERNTEKEAKKAEWKKLGDRLNFPKRWYHKFKDWSDKRKGVVTVNVPAPASSTGSTSSTGTSEPTGTTTSSGTTGSTGSGTTGSTQTPPAPAPYDANIEALKRNKKDLMKQLEELDEKIETEFAKIPMDVDAMKDLYAQKDKIYTDLMALEKKILEARLDYAKNNSKISDEEMIENLKKQKEVLESRVAQLDELLAKTDLTAEVRQGYTAERTTNLERLAKIEEDLGKLQTKTTPTTGGTTPPAQTTPVQGLGSGSQELVPGTNFVIPRRRYVGETIPEYEGYLAEHYKQQGLEHPIEFYPGTNVKKPRPHYPHELIKYTDNGKVVDGNYVDPYYNDMLKYYAEENQKVMTQQAPAVPDIPGAPAVTGTQDPVAINPINYGPMNLAPNTPNANAGHPVSSDVIEPIPRKINYGNGMNLDTTRSEGNQNSGLDSESLESQNILPEGVKLGDQPKKYGDGIFDGLDEEVEVLRRNGLEQNVNVKRNPLVNPDVEENIVRTNNSEGYRATPEVQKNYTEVKPRFKPIEKGKSLTKFKASVANKPTIRAVAAGKPKAKIQGVNLNLKGVQSVVRIADTIAKDIDIVTKRRIENNTTLIIIKSQTSLYQAKLKTIGDAKQNLEQVKSNLQMRNLGNGTTEIEVPANMSYEIDVEPVSLKR